MPQEQIECWNCGKTYDTTKTEHCPQCDCHKDDELREDNDDMEIRITDIETGIL